MERLGDNATAHFDTGEFIYAGLLDIPFIFDLVLDGSVAGSFSDRYLKRQGYLSILFLLLTSLRSLSWIFRTKKRELLLFMRSDVPVGFIQIEWTNTKAGIPCCYVTTCAIAPVYRGNHYGRDMIELLIARAPVGTEIWAYCTKYARAMQRTLKNLHFVRRTAGHGLDAYSFMKSRDDVAAADDNNLVTGALVR